MIIKKTEEKTSLSEWIRMQKGKKKLSDEEIAELANEIFKERGLDLNLNKHLVGNIKNGKYKLVQKIDVIIEILLAE